MFRLQIKSFAHTIWRAPSVMDTRVFVEAIQVADRLAQACRRTTVPSHSATRSWVVEIVGETGDTFYRAPVAAE